jgi:hypothetical protein
MGGRAAHRVLSRALPDPCNLHASNALLILHVCNPYQRHDERLANVAHVLVVHLELAIQRCISGPIRARSSTAR